MENFITITCGTVLGMLHICAIHGCSFMANCVTHTLCPLVQDKLLDNLIPLMKTEVKQGHCLMLVYRQDGITKLSTVNLIAKTPELARVSTAQPGSLLGLLNVHVAVGWIVGAKCFARMLVTDVKLLTLHSLSFFLELTCPLTCAHVCVCKYTYQIMIVLESTSMCPCARSPPSC